MPPTGGPTGVPGCCTCPAAACNVSVTVKNICCQLFAGVDVTAVSGSNTYGPATTNANGVASLSLPAAGSYTFTASKGTKTSSSTFNVVCGGNAGTILLRPDNIYVTDPYGTTTLPYIGLLSNCPYYGACRVYPNQTLTDYPTSAQDCYGYPQITGDWPVFYRWTNALGPRVCYTYCYAFQDEKKVTGICTNPTPPFFGEFLCGSLPSDQSTNMTLGRFSVSCEPFSMVYNVTGTAFQTGNPYSVGQTITFSE